MGIPSSAAVALLCDSQWNCQHVLEAFINVADRTLQKVGVVCRCSFNVMTKEASGDKDFPICMDSMSLEDSFSMPCGHSFCHECWHEYPENTTRMEGASCMTATCPDAKCQEHFSQQDVEIAAPELLENYKEYKLYSFSEAFGQWCPGPGCNRVVSKLFDGMLSSSRVADCNRCENMFCMECLETPHDPITCFSLRKNSEES